MPVKAAATKKSSGPGPGRRESHRGLSPAERQRADRLTVEEPVCRTGPLGAARVPVLRHENSKLKQVVADLTLDRHIL
jgi:hypothetical protein